MSYASDLKSTSISPERISILGACFEGAADPLPCAQSFCKGHEKSCMRPLMETYMRQRNPEQAMQFLERLIKEKKFVFAGNGHDAAHIIGRLSAEKSGMTDTGFLSCPENFYYGCQHGYFEAVLSKNPDMQSAAERLCRRASGEKEWACYHGVGHGVLMSLSYDLEESLNACSTMKKSRGKDACTQGVFMELIGATLREEVSGKYFDAKKPLEPCASFEQRVATSCYSQHATFLLEGMKMDIPKAIETCESEMRQTGQEACLRNIGQHAVARVSASLESGEAAHAEILRLCSPQGKASAHCIEGAAVDLLMYGQEGEALKLCSSSPENARDACFRMIDKRINALSSAKRQEICSSMHSHEFGDCSESLLQKIATWLWEILGSDV